MAGEERKHLAKLDDVFGGELAREPGGVGIVDGQRRLHAGERLVAVFESGERGAQLLRMRPVLGVVDDQEFTARLGEADIERLRLGARRRGRHDGDVDVRGRAIERGQRFGVVALDQKYYLQRVRRIIDPGQRSQQIADDVGFAIERAEDCVGGPARGLSDARQHRRQLVRGEQAQQDESGKHGESRVVQRRQRQRRRHAQRQADQRADGDEPKRLRDIEPPPGGAMREGAGETETRFIEFWRFDRRRRGAHVLDTRFRPTHEPTPALVQGAYRLYECNLQGKTGQASFINSPARPLRNSAEVSRTPKMAANWPKRGPLSTPNSTS